MKKIKKIKWIANLIKGIKSLLPFVHSIEASLMELKFRLKKKIRILIICLFGILGSIVIISVFSFFYKKNNALEYSGKVDNYKISPKDYYIYSAAIYFSGSLDNFKPSERYGRFLYLLECFISFVANSVFIAYLTFYMLKSEKTISLSKFIYITKRENHILLRTRIADYLNSYVNHNYTIEFYYWGSNSYRTTYLTFSYNIAELVHVFNTWTKIGDLDTPKSVEAKTYDYFKYLFSNLDDDRNFVCIILSATGKNGENVIIKKYYTLKDIKFCSECKDVMLWQKKHPYITKRIWGNLDRYILMSDVEMNDIKKFIRSQGKKLPNIPEWEIK